MPEANVFRLPLFPGFDALGALRHVIDTGYDYSWFVLDQATLSAEIALSGSEQNWRSDWEESAAAGWPRTTRSDAGGTRIPGARASIFSRRDPYWSSQLR